MAYTVRKQSEAIERALVAGYNALRVELATNFATYPHADTTSVAGGSYTAPTATALTVTAASATTLATCAARANMLKHYLNVHMADGVAHLAADATNTITSPDAALTDQTATNTLLNEIFTKYGAHRVLGGCHFTNDSTNVESSASATDLGSSETRCNDLVTQYNAHVVFALGGQSVTLVDA